MKLSEFFETVNKSNCDVDCYTDYDDSLACAYCSDPNTVLSEYGNKMFADVLSLEVTYKGCDCIIHIPNVSDKEMERLNDLVCKLIYGFAGYIGEDEYNKIFDYKED